MHLRPHSILPEGKFIIFVFNLSLLLSQLYTTFTTTIVLNCLCVTKTKQLTIYVLIFFLLAIFGIYVFLSSKQPVLLWF